MKGMLYVFFLCLARVLLRVNVLLHVEQIYVSIGVLSGFILEYQRVTDKIHCIYI